MRKHTAEVGQGVPQNTEVGQASGGSLPIGEGPQTAQPTGWVECPHCRGRVSEPQDRRWEDDWDGPMLIECDNCDGQFVLRRDLSVTPVTYRGVDLLS